MTALYVGLIVLSITAIVRIIRVERILNRVRQDESSLIVDLRVINDRITQISDKQILMDDYHADLGEFIFDKEEDEK